MPKLYLASGRCVTAQYVELSSRVIFVLTTVSKRYGEISVYHHSALQDNVLDLGELSTAPISHGRRMSSAAAAVQPSFTTISLKVFFNFSEGFLQPTLIPSSTISLYVFFNFCCSQDFLLISSQKEYSAKLGRQSSVHCSDFPFWNQCHTSVNFKSCHFSCNLGVDGAENLAYMGEMSPTDLGLNKTGEGTLTHTFLCSFCQFSLTFTGNPPSLISRLTSVMSIVKIVCDKPCIKSSKYVRIALNVNCEL